MAQVLEPPPQETNGAPGETMDISSSPSGEKKEDETEDVVTNNSGDEKNGGEESKSGDEEEEGKSGEEEEGEEKVEKSSFTKVDANNKIPYFLQVTNLSTKATDAQIRDLFAQIGPVNHVEIFPKDKHRGKFGVLVAFVEYVDPAAVSIAQHLTSTVFIDKPVVVVPAYTIPSEFEALQLASAMSSNRLGKEVAGDGTIKQLVPTIAPTIPSHIANPMLGNRPQPSILVTGLNQMKELSDTSIQVADNVRFISASGIPLPLPPKSLHEDYGDSRNKEVRRTVFIDNLHACLTAEHILNYFQFCGDIRFLRIGGDWMADKRFAFIEFIDLASVMVAVQYDGADFCNRRIRVVHSRHWLEKPPTKRSEQEREQDLIKKRLADAQALIAKSVIEDKPPSPKRSSRRSRSRDKSSRRRSRSRDKSRRSRSRDKKKKSRRRSRSRSTSRSKTRRRSKSREKRRSKSRDRRRSRSRDRGRRRSYSRERRH